MGLRYAAKKGFRASTGGRSRCPHCQERLRWYELIPIVSFLIQIGRCRSCHKPLSLQYPIVEILAGLTLVLVPLKLGWSLLTVLWILTFLVLIAVSIIDFRLGIIPDKLTFLIALIGGAVTAHHFFSADLYAGSLLGSYSWIFMWTDNFWLNRLVGVVAGLVFFGAIHFLTRGKAMGLGDVKLAGALGLLLGWPDIALVLVLSFIVGAAYATPLLLVRKKAMKDALAFGPFMVIGVTLVFFFGYHILNGYFRLFSGFYFN